MSELPLFSFALSFCEFTFVEVQIQRFLLPSLPPFCASRVFSHGVCGGECADLSSPELGIIHRNSKREKYWWWFLSGQHRVDLL